MNFTLWYEGSLPSGNSVRPQQKHAMRLAFHPQLADWRRQPAVGQNADLVAPVVISGARFTSLVHPRWNFQADLDITMLRPAHPQRGIVGDIDNGLKCLFDALARPQHDQDVPSGWKPAPGEDPVHCLLDDDSLIRTVNVRTDRLLAPKNPTGVMMMIHVTVQTTATFGGVALWGP